MAGPLAAAGSRTRIRRGLRGTRLLLGGGHDSGQADHDRCHEASVTALCGQSGGSIKWSPMNISPHSGRSVIGAVIIHQDYAEQAPVLTTIGTSNAVSARSPFALFPDKEQT